MNLPEIIFGQGLDAIYFALFMIFVKNLRTKRLTYVLLMMIEYFFIFNFIPYTLWSYILYFCMTYTILKLLYGPKSQIIDLFTLGIASAVMVFINIILFFWVIPLTNNYILFVMIERFILFSLLFIFKNKLHNIQSIYKHLWNRDDKVKKKIKSTTFRCLNLVVFNLMFYFINIGIIIFKIIRG